MSKKQKQETQVAPTARSLGVARSANAAIPPVDPSAPVRATLVRPTKGENPQRRGVYGYDNGEGGRVPTGAKVVVVDATALGAAWPSLAAALQLTPAATVADLKSAGVSSRALRRSFRSGYIRFQQ